MKIILFLLPSLVFALNVKELQCEKIGEYCFDPQVGLYKPKDREKAVQLKEKNLEGSTYKKVKGYGSDGVFNQSMMNCDANKFFDVFCNSKKKK